MKHTQRRWQKMFVALIAGLVAGWMLLKQAVVTPSEAEVPQGLQKASGPHAKLLPPKLPASSTPPPDELEQGPPPPDQTSRHRPTKQELLEKIRQMPGGQEMIEEARRRGARIGMRSEEPGTSLSWLDPFRVEKVEAQSSLSLTLDPSNGWISSPLYGAAGFKSILYGYSYPVTSSVDLWAGDFSSAFGTKIIEPTLFLSLEAPADGWYLFNMEATGAQVSLKHVETGSYPTVASWKFGGRTGIQSYPTVLELTAGGHYFYWVVESSLYPVVRTSLWSGQHVYVYEVSVNSI